MKNIFKSKISLISVLLILVIVGFLSFTNFNSLVSAAQQIFTQGGNAFGELAILGTTDNFGLSIKTNNIERVRIRKNGNVGIGTNTPTEALEVVGNFLLNGQYPSKITSDGSNSVISGGLQTGGDVDLNFLADAWTIGATSNGLPLEFRPGGQTPTVVLERPEPSNFTFFTVKTDGKIGIGTTTPVGTLQIVDSINSTAYVGSSIKSGCLVLGDSDGDGITYITVNDGVLSATTTKLSICQ